MFKAFFFGGGLTYTITTIFRGFSNHQVGSLKLRIAYKRVISEWRGEDMPRPYPPWLTTNQLVFTPPNFLFI